MKSMKKFLALALALALCFAMAIPAMAAETTTLTMKDVTPGHTYTVYQVFTGDVSTAEVDGKEVKRLSNVQYGQSYTGKEGNVPQDELTAIADANAFAKGLLDNNALSHPVATDWNGSELSVAPGYYVVVDNGLAEGEENVPDADSAYIVEIVGPTTITPKTTIPELDKEVKRAEDPNYSENDAITSEIGKLVEFKLTAKVPAKELPKYAVANKDGEAGTYKLVFHDTMSEGLTFVDFKDVMYGEVKVENTAEKTLYVAVNEGQEITITIEDLFEIIGRDEKEWKTDDNGNIVITATYTAKLNEKAIVNNGGSTDETNFNKAHLEYSNDPNDEGTGNTPEDKTYVYSFKLDITKYENDTVENGGKVLAGAGFTLYRVTTSEDGEEVLTELKFKAIQEADGIKYVLSEDEDAESEVRSGEDGKLNFTGLEAGKYKLVETTVPDGFNKCADRYITISAKVDGEGENAPSLEDVKIEQEIISDTTGAGNEGTVEDSEGTAMGIINKSGTLLPSTGGIGTTIFYAVGGALVVGAGILLFVKKRMGSKG